MEETAKELHLVEFGTIRVLGVRWVGLRGVETVEWCFQLAGGYRWNIEPVKLAGS